MVSRAVGAKKSKGRLRLRGRQEKTRFTKRRRPLRGCSSSLRQPEGQNWEGGLTWETRSSAGAKSLGKKGKGHTWFKGTDNYGYGLFVGSDAEAAHFVGPLKGGPRDQ